jgi:hypothetical protein
MSIYTDIGAPALTDETYGQYTLHRAHLCDTTTAAPVVPININGIQNFSIGVPSFDERILKHQGSRSSVKRRRNPMWGHTLSILTGKMPSVIAQLKGITWGSANDRAISLWDSRGVPAIHWEAVCRDINGITPLFSVVVPQAIIDPWGFENPMDSAEQSIPLSSEFPPIFLYAYTQWVWDLFDGDGSTTDFTLSSTPTDLVNSTTYDDFVLDNIALVTVKGSTDSTGILQLSGVSYAGGIVSFTTAPAASSLVGIGYATAVAAP